jgi:hypothetical protein
MADFSIKAHDRLPAVQATLTNASGPVDLSSALGVKFIMKLINGVTTKVNAAAVLIDAPSGVVRYDWIAADTDTPGSYRAEWEITWADGRKQTAPTLSYHTIDVLADLDGA